MKNSKSQLDELRDIIALDKYGKTYKALPDDGAQQDYVAGEADRRMKLTCTPAVAGLKATRRNDEVRDISAPHPTRPGMRYAVAEVYGFTPAEADANADLFCAAPSLLAALENILREANFDSDGDSASRGEKLLAIEDMAKDAISKSSGQ